MRIRKVISGGQTGADIAALRAAKRSGIPTGGTAPAGWLTEDGPKPQRLQSFGLTECQATGYPARTKKNVMDADITLIFTDTNDGGSALTAKYCAELGKPHLVVPPDSSTASVLTLLGWLRAQSRDEVTINVAGNRRSKSPHIEEKVEEVLVKVFEAINGVYHAKAKQSDTGNQGSRRNRRNPTLFKN